MKGVLLAGSALSADDILSALLIIMVSLKCLGPAWPRVRLVNVPPSPEASLNVPALCGLPMEAGASSHIRHGVVVRGRPTRRTKGAIHALLNRAPILSSADDNLMNISVSSSPLRRSGLLLFGWWPQRTAADTPVWLHFPRGK